MDKHGDEDLFDRQQMLVIDGEFFGGPTRFMNHSCEPNCGVYVVKYNKNDMYRYNLAFFAVEDIPKGQELTFDYKENDIDADFIPDEDSIPCKCGASCCRGYLWN
jgi:histone-lysine N-methyltransferase SUV39H